MKMFKCAGDWGASDEVDHHGVVAGAAAEIGDGGLHVTSWPV